MNFYKKSHRQECWRLILNDEVHKEIEPFTGYMRKNRISFFGHKMRISNKTNKTNPNKTEQTKDKIKLVERHTRRRRHEEFNLNNDDLINKTNKKY